jgi:tungstate transport system substrate-binding protein
MRQRHSATRYHLVLLTLSSIFVLGAVFGLYDSGFSQEYRQIVIATGSPFELGLVDEFAKAFQQKFGGTVRCIKTPTEPGLELGKHGLTHITMGHEREATARFAKEGFAAKRTDLMHNFTVLVGPYDDPAKIEGLTDIKEIHRRIAQAKAPYLSRGDGGGMHLLEIRTWKELNINPQGEKWFQVSQKFMLASLLDADRNKQYHMLDSSTWALHKTKTKNLRLLVKGPANEYEMCLVNTLKHPHLKYNYDLAEKFYDFLVGNEGQKIIAEFGIKQFGEPIYYPTVIRNPK